MRSHDTFERFPNAAGLPRLPSEHQTAIEDFAKAVIRAQPAGKDATLRFATEYFASRAPAQASASQSAQLPDAPAAVVPAGGDVPARVARLFREFDTVGDGVVHLHELETALAREFPELSEDVQREVRPLFDHHTAPTGGGLTMGEFNEMYGALLFRNFDANHDGVLQSDELARALEYLGGTPACLGMPLDASGADAGMPVVTREVFWAIYLSYMDEEVSGRQAEA